MKNYLFLMCMLVAIGLSSCNSEVEETKEVMKDDKQSRIIDGSFAHIVFFWLKNPDSEEDKTQLKAALEKLAKSSEYAKLLHIGTPAATDRGVIDNSYSFCMVLTFDNKEQQDKYQVEPVHLEFVETSQHLWDKVVVYDSENFLQ